MCVVNFMSLLTITCNNRIKRSGHARQKSGLAIVVANIK